MSTCGWSGCEAPHSGKGLCSMHYQRRLRGVDMDAPRRRRRKKGEPPEPCVIEGCDGLRNHADGLCPMHYQRRLAGRPMDTLWVTSQPSGQRLEDLVAWVVETYPGQVAAALTETASVA